MISDDMSKGFSPIRTNFVNRLANDAELLKNLVENINRIYFFFYK